ncbi:LysR family transcriptional regulator [Acidisoma cellulosilytica]|uniref:LysR family transcriptional regulator n=1 Tax=Acidisoma cellulosilyticum TaxID=2802395 RepID=A0A963Z052_9PROT|nr:LysR family transcriptional regulator [Acidisoma cellulosilyticum]MCB8879567.1 LysR family transcriptional regulator [Acidisoma cellulosilyticum]
MLHPDLLRSFVAVAEAGGFSLAARRLGLGQSTVSQHIKRLEDAIHRPVFARDTHSVTLTPDGDTLLALARQVLAAQDRLLQVMTGTATRGRLRLGVSEDFAAAGLRAVLQDFARLHPTVDVALTVGLSVPLYERFDSGDLDVIFVKRRTGDRRGAVVWRERLVWLGQNGIRPDPHAPLPLLLYPSPSITRGRALTALEAAGRSWRIACTSGSLNGLYAAAEAGLGLIPHSGRLRPTGLAVLSPSPTLVLPDLGEIEFVVIGPGSHNLLAESLLDIFQSYALQLPSR